MQKSVLRSTRAKQSMSISFSMDLEMKWKFICLMVKKLRSMTINRRTSDLYPGDKLSQVPESFSVIASTPNAPLAAIVHDTEPYYGIQ